MSDRRSGSRRAGRGLAQGRLRGGEPRDRHAERRARHIVELDLVTEGDRSRVAAVLPADADFELGTDFSSALDADAHQFADALLIDRHERIAGQDAARGIDAEEARRVVARMPKVVCVRSLVPNEKNSAVSAISPAINAARGNSIMVPTW